MSIPFYVSRPPKWTPTRQDYYDGTGASLVGSGALSMYLRSSREFQAVHVTGTMKPDAAPEHYVLGSLVDALITEPENFGRLYRVDDPGEVERAGEISANAAKWGFVKRQEGQTVITQDLLTRAKAIAEVLHERKHTRDKLFCDGPFQVAHKWTEHGVKCRGKFDKVFATNSDRPVLVDLKVLREATDEHIRRELFRYIITQLCLYELAMMDLWQETPVVFLVVIQSRPPYSTWADQISPAFMDIGRRRVDAGLRALGECFKTNDWRSEKERALGTMEPAAWMTKSEP